MTKARDLADFLGNNTSLNTINNAYAAGTLIPTVTTINPNMVMNGDFRIDQRNSGATINPTTYQHGMDRWFYSGFQGSNNYYTIGQSTDAPSGFSNSLLITSTTSSSAIGLWYVRNNFEGYDVSHLDYGTASAKTTTISFWAKSSMIGTYGVILGVPTSPSSNYSKTYTINVANTWEYKTITIPGNTTHTPPSGTAKGIRITFAFGLSNRPTPADAWGSPNDSHGIGGLVDFLGTNGATLQLTGIKWEVGSEATDFQHTSYGEELAKCQRYFFKSSNQATSMADATSPSYSFRGKRYSKHSLPAVMRANPSVTAIQYVANYSGGITAGGQHDYVYLAPSGTSQLSGTLYWYGGFTADAEL
jgi:hypothetical protein